MTRLFYLHFFYNIGYSHSFCLVLQSGKEFSVLFKTKQEQQSRQGLQQYGNTALAELLAKARAVSRSVRVVVGASYLNTLRKEPSD